MTSPASARDATSIAKQHFKAGRDLYKQGQYAKAAAEFKAAYAAKPRPSILFNLAECDEKLGDAQHALENYRAYLKQRRDATDRPTVEASIRSLAAKLRETPTQPLLVNSAPEGAHVALDGHPEGMTPFSKEAKVATRTKLDIILGPAVGSNDAIHPDGTLEPVTGVSGAATPHGRLWTWVALGVGGGALAGAAVAGAWATSDSHKLLQNGHHNPSEAQQLYDSAASKSHVSNALLGVGLVAAGAGAALFFVEGKF